MAIFIPGQKLLAAQLNDMNIERIMANSGFDTIGVGSFGSISVNSGIALAPAPATMVADEAYQESILSAWINFQGTNVTSSDPVDLTGVAASYNVTGVQDNATGDYTIHWDTDFAGASFIASVTQGTAGPDDVSKVAAHAAGTLQVATKDTAGNVRDANLVMIMAAGDH